MGMMGCSSFKFAGDWARRDFSVPVVGAFKGGVEALHDGGLHFSVVVFRAVYHCFRSATYTCMFVSTGNCFLQLHTPLHLMIEHSDQQADVAECGRNVHLQTSTEHLQSS